MAAMVYFSGDYNIPFKEVVAIMVEMAIIPYSKYVYNLDVSVLFFE